jgi:hypothetical protein
MPKMDKDLKYLPRHVSQRITSMRLASSEPSQDMMRSHMDGGNTPSSAHAYALKGMDSVRLLAKKISGRIGNDDGNDDDNDDVWGRQTYRDVHGDAHRRSLSPRTIPTPVSHTSTARTAIDSPYREPRGSHRHFASASKIVEDLQKKSARRKGMQKTSALVKMKDAGSGILRAISRGMDRLNPLSRTNSNAIIGNIATQSHESDYLHTNRASFQRLHGLGRQGSDVSVGSDGPPDGVRTPGDPQWDDEVHTQLHMRLRPQSLHKMGNPHPKDKHCRRKKKYAGEKS